MTRRVGISKQTQDDQFAFGSEDGQDILYSDQLRSYQLEDSPIKRLKTLDNGNPDITGLSQALAPACKCPRSFDLIIQWLRRDALINQRALVLIVQASLRNPPMLGLKEPTHSIEVLKLIARNKLHTTYPEEWKIMKPHCHQTFSIEL